MSLVSDLDEHLPKIQKRSTSAFGQWVTKAEPILRSSLRPFAAVVDAEAVIQEALLRIWQVAPKVRPDGEANGLLRVGLRITKNLAISEVRHAQLAQSKLEALEVETTLNSALPDPILRRAIERCSQRLPKQSRRVLSKRLAQDGLQSDVELAAELGMKTNTFLKNFGRARRSLQQCLRAQGIEL